MKRLLSSFVVVVVVGFAFVLPTVAPLRAESSATHATPPGYQLVRDYPITAADLGRPGKLFFMSGMGPWPITHGLGGAAGARPGAIDGVDRVKIGAAPDGRPALECLAPAGEVINWNFRTLGSRPIVTMPLRASVELWIPDGFEWSRTQRLALGLWGGGAASFYGGEIAPADQDGFFVGVAHSPREGLRLYSYHLNRTEPTNAAGAMPATFSPLRSGARLPTGRWVTLGLDIAVNTPEAADGSARLWLEGKLIAELTGLRFRTPQTNWTVRGLLMHDVWGEGRPEPADYSPRAQRYWYSNYRLFARDSASSSPR